MKIEFNTACRILPLQKTKSINSNIKSEQVNDCFETNIQKSKYKAISFHGVDGKGKVKLCFT